MNDEIDNLVAMLEDELEWFRVHNNPNNSGEHKRTRIMLTLAKSIQELQPPKSR